MLGENVGAISGRKRIGWLRTPENCILRAVIRYD